MFVTDDRGRVAHAESELTYRPPEEAAKCRNNYQQGIAGREFRLEIDEGGHLVGVGLGGPGEGINIVAMEKALNRQGGESWGSMEMELIRALKIDPSVRARLVIDVGYPGVSKRPDVFWVTPHINGEPLPERMFEQ